MSCSTPEATTVSPIPAVRTMPTQSQRAGTGRARRSRRGRLSAAATGIPRYRSRNFRRGLPRSAWSCAGRAIGRSLAAATGGSVPDAAGPIGSARMTVHHETFTLDTRGDGEVIDVTDLAEKSIANCSVAEGTVTIFVAHSTCGVTIIECEPGCNADLNAVLEGLAPETGRWEHNERNADTNGHSHVRAGIIGPSVTVPITGGEMMLGVWQRVICVDFDDRARSRRLVISVVGE